MVRWSLVPPNASVPAAERGPHAPSVLAAAILHRELLRLHTVLNVKELVRAAFGLVHRALPVHSLCLSLWPDDPRNRALFRDRNPPHTLEDAARYAALYPLASALRHHPTRRVVRQTDCLTIREIRRTPFYREIMVPEGWLYHCILPFRDGDSLLGLFSLYRRATQGDFLGAEVRLLEALHPHLAVALRRVHRLNQERGERASAESMLERLPLPVILADWNLRVLFANHVAARLCADAALGPRARFLKLPRRPALPPSVRRLCRRLKARGAGRTGAVASTLARAHLKSDNGSGADRAWEAHVSLQGLDSASFNKPVFLIHFSPATAGRTPSGPGAGPSPLGHLVNLTPSERRVAFLVRDGLSNDEVARELGKSPRTVAKQLQSVFQKLRVNNRTRLAALIG